MTAIPIQEWTVVPLVGGGYVVRLRSGPYDYEADCDGTLAGIALAMSGALKFFGLKYGVVTVEQDGLVRNAQRAKEQGFA